MILNKNKKYNTGTVLFPNDLPVNALTHLCMNGFNFCAITGWEIQKSRKLMSLILDPKLRKFEIKRRKDKINRLFCLSDNARFILLYFYLYKSDKQNDMKIINMWFKSQPPVEITQVSIR